MHANLAGTGAERYMWEFIKQQRKNFKSVEKEINSENENL